MLNSLNAKLIMNTPSLNNFQPVSKRIEISKLNQHPAFDTVCFSGKKVESTEKAKIEELKNSLQFFNGIGGFSQDGKEYVIVLEKGKTTPLPWANVISNNKCSFIITESGGGHTSVNGKFNALTQWSNDPVTDPQGEVFYIRDNKTNKLWSPTSAPIRNKSTYVVRHGIGYTKFENIQNGIKSDLLQYVAKDDPVKISKLTLENTTDQEKELSVANYTEWAFGEKRKEDAQDVITERDPYTGAIFVTNTDDGFMRSNYRKHVAFIDLNNGQLDSFTGDRKEFLGKYGQIDKPSGLINSNKQLSNKLGKCLDPCTALQTKIILKPHQKIELNCLMGQAEDRNAALTIIKKYRESGKVDTELLDVKEKWEDTLGKVQVKLPENDKNAKAMEIMSNVWLSYQNLSSRMQAKTAFYQNGGAKGFRDQGQDCAAFIISNPSIARNQIIESSGRQFIEDKSVQHWWFNDTEWGSRSHHRDDGTWLPLIASEYITVTGDKDILNVETPYLENPDGQPLSPEGEEDCVIPKISHQKASVYQHCAEILDSRMETGIHGLPLMGGGDWNDGMNEVGRGPDGKGKGESIWLGMFQCEVFSKFAKIAEDRGDLEHATKWNQHVAKLEKSIDESAWDGEWYKRAWFHDGSPLGSKENTECKIDLLPQAWATWTLNNTPERRARAEQAMDSLDKLLFNKVGKLIHLFTPPFKDSNPSPGYIQGYVAGTRENGGQYTHAATWAVKGFTELEKNKQGEKAYDGASYDKKAYGDKAFEAYSAVCPINHALDQKGVNTYKTEPYVLAADVYGVAPHIGRGGWSWYTGSAGWLDRVGKESILGFKKIGDFLSINPCIPKKWDGFKIDYKHVGSDNDRKHTTNYHITVENPDHVSSGVKEILVDNKPLTDETNLIPLVNDKKEHEVKVILGNNLI